MRPKDRRSCSSTRKLRRLPVTNVVARAFNPPGVPLSHEPNQTQVRQPRRRLSHPIPNRILQRTLRQSPARPDCCLTVSRTESDRHFGTDRPSRYSWVSPSPFYKPGIKYSARATAPKYAAVPRPIRPTVIHTQRGVDSRRGRTVGPSTRLHPSANPG